MVFSFIALCHLVTHEDLAAWITGITVLTLGGEGHYGSYAKGLEAQCHWPHNLGGFQGKSVAD